jgi:hypothetical protein
MKKRSLYPVIATLYMSAASAAGAQSYSTEQRNAMNHVSQVLAAAAACPEYESNDTMLAVIGMHYKFDISEDKTRSVIVAKAKEHKAGMEAMGKTTGCLAAWALYGPGGQNVPNLLRRK